MLMDRPGDVELEVDIEDDYNIILTAPADDEPAGERVTLFRFRCFSEAKFHAAMVWMGERQHLWGEWRDIAESEGEAALASHLVRIAKRVGIDRFGDASVFTEPLLGVLILPGGDPLEIEIVAELETQYMKILGHRFATTERRDAFFLSIADPVTVGGMGLVMLALMRGRDALTAFIERGCDPVAAAGAQRRRSSIH